MNNSPHEADDHQIKKKRQKQQGKWLLFTCIHKLQDNKFPLHVTYINSWTMKSFRCHTETPGQGSYYFRCHTGTPGLWYHTD